MKPLRHFVWSGVIALLGLVCIVAAMWALPGASRSLLERDFSEHLGRDNAQRLMDHGRRLGEIREFLEKEIAAGTTDALLFALRGRLKGIEEGPEAGFAYLVNLFKKRNFNEEVAPYAEGARQAALAGRWDDAFALFRLLHDYGEDETIKQLLDDGFARLLPTAPPGDGEPTPRLWDDGMGVRVIPPGIIAVLASDAGLRFLAAAGWDDDKRRRSLGLGEEKSRLLSLWHIERSLALDGKAGTPEEMGALAGGLATDSRAMFLGKLTQFPGLPGSADRFPPPGLPGCDAVVGPQDVVHDGARLATGAWSAAGEYQAQWKEPVAEAWAILRGSPLLAVFPLAILDLDGETQILYLQQPYYFPERFRRRDGKPFGKFAIAFVNDFRNEGMEMDRDIGFEGLMVRRGQAASAPEGQ